MTIRAAKFTPEVLLEAPRRSEGLPNADGSQVLYSVSTYSFAQHTKKSEIRLLDVESQQSSLITDDKAASEPAWIDDETIVLLTSGEDGTTNVVVGDPKNFEKRYTDLKRYGSQDFTPLTTSQQVYHRHHPRSYRRSEDKRSGSWVVWLGILWKSTT